MATSFTITHPDVELKRLNELRSALMEGIIHCSEVAFSVANQTLRKTLLVLEQQVRQYANEVNAQIEALGGHPKDISSTQIIPMHFADEKKALEVCLSVERSVIRLYRKMLTTHFEHETIKKMIREQMNGIMSRTLQLKLLSKFLHNQ